jgi:hypothetical protein
VNVIIEQTLLPDPGLAAGFVAEGVELRADQLLRMQGYTDLGAVRRPIRRAAQRAAEVAIDIAEGRVGCRRVAVSALRPGVLELEGGHAFRCGAFGRYLAGCESVLVFALTAGPAFDVRIDEMMRGDQPVEALFLDSAGWLAVESVTRQFVDRVKADAGAKGLRVTRRMGPGYSYRVGSELQGWSLEEQRGLFQALGDAPLPVVLMDSAAMSPKMSRSGLYGLRAESP